MYFQKYTILANLLWNILSVDIFGVKKKYILHLTVTNIFLLKLSGVNTSQMYPFQEELQRTAKLDLEVNLLHLKSVHNHPLENYSSGIYALKTKCKRSAQCSSDGLRHVFNDVTRSKYRAVFPLAGSLFINNS